MTTGDTSAHPATCADYQPFTDDNGSHRCATCGWCSAHHDTSAEARAAEVRAEVEAMFNAWIQDGDSNEYIRDKIVDWYFERERAGAAEAEARNAELEAALRKALMFEHAESRCLDVTGAAICRSNAHQTFGVLRAALSRPVSAATTGENDG